MIELLDQTSSYSTTTTIQGTAEEVQQAIERYFENYSPFGYGTRVLSDTTDGDVRTVTIRRDNSCD